MAGTWQPLANQPPFNASTMLLLTDGTVMCQESGGRNWWRLRPNQFGDYVQGTWSSLSPMQHSRLYYASAVLADGRVFVAGGEYSDGGGDLNAAEMYDPIWDTWTNLPVPQGWTNIGDAPCCVLPDGRLLLGSIFTNATAIYDPTMNTWTAAASKDDSSSEETWTLLPDESVLTVECSNHPKAEKYVAPGEKWVSASITPADLVQASSIEIGPALLLPDGRVFAIGATGHSAVYTPPQIADQLGSWAAGPDFPNFWEAKDAPACLLPSGNVLCAVGPPGEGGNFPSPTQFFEFDGANLNAVPNPPNNGGPPYVGRMLLLPSGQVLFANGSTDVEVYTPDGGPDPAWRPQITGYPVGVERGHAYVLQGRQLNGLSQAVSYGDDATMATNYPLVRIRNLASGKVWYGRTFDHSSMGVATGTSLQSTNFKVPCSVDDGPGELCVVANGIASQCVTINVGPFHARLPFEEEVWLMLIGSLADGPLWAIGPDGHPVPVDPWGPELRGRVRESYRSIIRAIKELQAIGKEVAGLRVEARAERVPTGPSGTRRRKPRQMTAP